jgi:SOS-response transcriptional repressor LexA
LIDASADRAWFRMRTNFAEIADPEDVEVLEALEAHIREAIDEAGATAYLKSLEDSASNAMRITDPQSVPVDAFSRVLDRLYQEHVEAVPAQPFRTHLPLYSFRAAAGGLSDEMESAVEDWVPAPAGMQLSPDLFMGHVAGRSMEPRIPDGSLNLFRLHPAGSRQGKILLIERFGVLDETARYTIKRYTSRKVYRSAEEWQHENVRLEPLNPEFEAWDVEPDGFAVVAEWLRVIE